MKNFYDTIIIGAGVAGLGCAHTLRKHGKPFKIISENLGGRIQTSEDGSVNLGAIIVTDDYKHVLPFVTKERRVRMSQVTIHKGKDSYGFFSLSGLPYIFSYLKLRKELRKFRRAYALFRERAEHMSQKRAMEADSYLLGLYHQLAIDFVKEKGIESFCSKFLCEGIYAFTFTHRHKINAFAYLHFLQLVIVPFYIFKVNKQKLFDPLKKNTVLDTVTEVNKVEDYYEIKTSSKTFRAKNLAVATPINVSKKLLKFRKSKSAVSAHVLHVKGVPRDRYSKPSQAFFAPEEVYAFLKQPDGTFVVYARVSKPNLSKYFSEHEVLEETYWKNAEFMVGTELLESDRSGGLYVIGDYNIAGLEDSFITGVYAANEIIQSTN